MRWAKPIDADAVARAAACKLVVTLEEGATDGGAGEGVLDVLSKLGAEVPTLVIGLPDEFVMQGKPDQVRARLGIDANGVLARINEKLASL
jgi:1-deoxy-D-xylulose-5-phosphate synthase